MSKRIRKAIGVRDFLAKKFETIPIPFEWEDHIGQLATRFTMCIYGDSANGKTDYAIKLAKMLAAFGNVFYNSKEQGISPSLQLCIERNNLTEVSGKVSFGCEDFDVLKIRLDKRKSARFVVLDSRDQMNLTYDQYLELEARYPKKSFIVLCYEKGAKAKGEHGINIQFRCEVKVRVRLFVAYAYSRYGGNGEYTVWEAGASKARARIREWKQLETNKS